VNARPVRPPISAEVVDGPGGCGQRPGRPAQLAALDPPVGVDALDDEELSFDDDEEDEDDDPSEDEEEDEELSDDVAAFRLSVR
jgi:hypothetical protein